MTLIPSFNAIAPSLKGLFSARESDHAASCLLNLYMTNWDFDENWYLSSYPDLAEAIPSRDFPSGHAHFLAIGYKEGRLPIKPEVDATWYMANYPDVATAILKGTFESASQHFLASGYREGRLGANPDIDIVWYAKTYLDTPTAGDATLADCLTHFKSFGYLNGALPGLRKSWQQKS